MGREGIYNNLTNIFDDELVRRAMNALPYETDPKVLCKHILSMEKTPNAGQP